MRENRLLTLTIFCNLILVVIHRTRITTFSLEKEMIGCTCYALSSSPTPASIARRMTSLANFKFV